MGVLLSMNPILLGFVILTMCLVALILSTTILVFALKAKTNINVTLSVNPLILSFLTGSNIDGVVQMIKNIFTF